MERSLRVRHTAALLLPATWLLAAPLAAQSLDYHLEETPAVSWNRVSLSDARLLALGGVSLLASDPLAAAVNPARVPADSRYGLAASGAGLRFEAMQFRGINQGVWSNAGPLSDEVSLASAAAGYLATRQGRVAAGWYVSSLPRFPPFTARRDMGHGQYEEGSLSFSGREDVFFVAAAPPVWRGLSFGARLDYSVGRRELVDRLVTHYNFVAPVGFAAKDIELREEQSHETRGFSGSLGISWRISPRWTVAGQLTSPFPGTADRSLIRSFDNSSDNVRIVDRQSTSDRLYRPQGATLGAAFEIDLPGQRRSKSIRLRLGVEAAGARWSRYRYQFFGEEQPRDLRDTLGLAAGMELVFMDLRDLSLRVGYRRDPQPVKEPATTLEAVSAGVGLRLGALGLDGGASRYRGSVGGFEQQQTVLAVTLSYVSR